MPDAPDRLLAWLRVASAACGPTGGCSVGPDGVVRLHVARALWSAPGDLSPWRAYMAATPPPVPVVLIGAASPPAPPPAAPTPPRPRRPTAPAVPRAAVWRPPRSAHGTARISDGVSFDPQSLFRPHPWHTALAVHQAAAVARWDADAAPQPRPRRIRGASGTRTLYRPLFDGIRDPDPRDVDRRWHGRPLPA